MNANALKAFVLSKNVTKFLLNIDSVEILHTIAMIDTVIIIVRKYVDRQTAALTKNLKVNEIVVPSTIDFYQNTKWDLIK